jgi:hypothetical protein
MKFYKNPRASGLILSFIVWLVASSYYTEYVLNRPVPSWMVYTGAVFLLLITGFMLSMAFNYFFRFLELDRKEEKESESENQNQ